MKTLKLIKLEALAVTVLMVLSTHAGAATIAGTAHDLSAYANSAGQICITCHTPHNAQSTQLVPLWNHTSTTSVFTLYSSTTLNAVPGQPSNNSKACLSCHDGTVALDSFGGKVATVGFMTGDHNLTTDLSNDHPVSFTFDAALATADGGLVTPSSLTSVDAAKTVPLYLGKVECATCHNPHDNTFTPFLRKSNAASALCLTCHNK